MRGCSREINVVIHRSAKKTGGWRRRLKVNPRLQRTYRVSLPESNAHINENPIGSATGVPAAVVVSGPTGIPEDEAGGRLIERHLADLRNSGLADQTIADAKLFSVRSAR